MSSGLSESKRKEYQAKVILVTIFLGTFSLFIVYMIVFGPGLKAFELRWMDILLLGFATYRLGHLIAYERVFEPFRQFFTETVPDPTGAGDTVEPKGKGWQNAIGQLVCCPICSGTWIAAGLVYLLYLWPDPMRVFLLMTAAIGMAELLNAGSEFLSWSAQHQRTLTGAQMNARKKNIVRIEQNCEDTLPEREEVRSMSIRVKKRE